MPIVQADRLSRIGAALLKAAGASNEEAGAVAIGCVNANLAGHDSHGTIMARGDEVLRCAQNDSKVRVLRRRLHSPARTGRSLSACGRYL